MCLRMVASAGSHFYKLNSICSRVLWAVVGKPAWVYLELMGVTKEMTEHERERSWTYGLVMVVRGGPLSILLLSFVMGMAAILLGRVRLDHSLAWREILVMLAVIAVPITVLWDGQLTRPEGLFLVGVYILHAFILNRDGGKKKKRERGGLEGLEKSG